MPLLIDPPTERQYAQARISLALGYCPRIYPCAKCQWPVMDGYCCTYCQTSEPSEPWPKDLGNPVTDFVVPTEK